MEEIQDGADRKPKAWFAVSMKYAGILFGAIAMYEARIYVQGESLMLFKSSLAASICSLLISCNEYLGLWNINPKKYSQMLFSKLNNCRSGIIRIYCESK